MKITNVFDAVRDGTYEEFIHFFNGNVNEVDEDLGLNLLELALVNNKHEKDKIKIIEFLIAEKIDLNYVDKRYKRNALHTFYFNVLRPSPKYMLEVTKLLMENGIDVNEKDKFDAVPLKYAITITKQPTEDIKQVYRYLLQNNADYKTKDVFGKSCLDYMKEYAWRNRLLDFVKEFENTDG